MEIIAKVIGIRLWDRSEEQIRHATLEWVEEKTEKNQYPTHYTLDLKDPTKQFDLGDEVIINLTKVEIPGYTK